MRRQNAPPRGGYFCLKPAPQTRRLNALPNPPPKRAPCFFIKPYKSTYLTLTKVASNKYLGSHPRYCMYCTLAENQSHHRFCHLKTFTMNPSSYDRRRRLPPNDGFLSTSEGFRALSMVRPGVVRRTAKRLS